jgi:hypothetical protein
VYRDLIRIRPLFLALVLLLAGLAAGPALAGTQDFTLVNQTGVEIFSLYLSETTNDEWEEDVLGDRVLPHGNRLDINFHGRRACLWDILITDEDDNQVTWSAINLCEATVVVLRCDDSECWAEWE